MRAMCRWYNLGLRGSFVVSGEYVFVLIINLIGGVEEGFQPDFICFFVLTLIYPLSFLSLLSHNQLPYLHQRLRHLPRKWPSMAL